ncbi:MAG: murein biosynthesis integral membrane protein MurJ [bacterium]
MMQRIFSYLNKEIKGLHEAAYFLAIFTFLSQVLGLVRDKLLAHFFGASAMLDVYYASFRIPDLIFVTISSLVAVSALIPFVVRENKKGKEKEEHFINSVFTVFSFSMVLVIGLVAIFVPVLLKFLVPGIYNGTYQSTLILMTRILLLSPLLLGVSNLLSSVNQSRKIFIVSAISPLLYNLAIIFGIVFLYPKYGLIGLVIGVIFGSLLHVIIQIPSIAVCGIKLSLTRNIDWKSVREVITLSIPRTFTLAGNQLSMTSLFYLASFMTAGSISVLALSYNLQSVPLAIIGLSYSSAAFPTLAKLYSEGKKSEFISHVVSAARHIIFWSIPVAILFVVLRAQIVRVIFGSGNFNWDNTRLTAASLALFSLSVTAQSLELLFVRGFYSAGMTKKPLVISTITSVLAFVFAIGGVLIFNSFSTFRSIFESIFRVSGVPGTVALMLPLAFTLAALINIVWLWRLFEKDFSGFGKTLLRTLFDSLVSSLVMGYVAYISLDFFGKFLKLSTLSGIFLQGFISGILGIIAGTSVLFFLKNAEIKEIAKALHHKILGTKTVVPEQSGL